MPDVLVRDLDAALLARIDAAAQRQGLSRNALLRALLLRFAEEQDAEPLTDDEVARFGAAAQHLTVPARREDAWRR
jgi:hypothetical protein